MQGILGISLGTSDLGFAFLSYGSLTKWNVKTFPGEWNAGKLRLIINSIRPYVINADVDALAVKIPEELMHLSLGMMQLIGAVNVLVEQMGIQIHYYSLSDLKLFHASDVCINKKVLFECVIRKYPDLYGVYQKEQKANRAYYGKLFEAVATAHVCYKQQFD